MSAAQKKRRDQPERLHGRPDPQAVRKDVRELLAVVIGSQPEVTIFSDDHKACPRAMVRGMCDRPLTVEDILAERTFPTKVELPDRWGRYCRGEVETRGMANEKRRERKAAY